LAVLAHCGALHDYLLNESSDFISRLIEALKDDGAYSLRDLSELQVWLNLRMINLSFAGE
jgi:hypothetical protein